MGTAFQLLDLIKIFKMAVELCKGVSALWRSTHYHQMGLSPHSGSHYPCDPDVAIKGYRPLSRRLDRCDRVIQDEVGDSNVGNV